MLFILVPFGSAQARVLITETTNYYNIRGKNAKALLKQIQRKRLFRRGKKYSVSTTKVKLKIDGSKLDIVGHRCVIKDIRLKLTLVYTIPRWVNIGQGSRNTRNAWKAYYKQIIQHSKKQGTIAKNMAKTLDRSIRNIPAEHRGSAAGCHTKSKDWRMKSRKITTAGRMRLIESKIVRAPAFRSWQGRLLFQNNIAK